MKAKSSAEVTEMLENYKESKLVSKGIQTVSVKCSPRNLSCNFQARPSNADIYIYTRAEQKVSSASAAKDENNM